MSRCTTAIKNIELTAKKIALLLNSLKKYMREHYNEYLYTADIEEM